MQVRRGLFSPLIVLVLVATGCTAPSATPAASTGPTEAETIDLDGPPEANLDLGSGTLVVAAGGDGLPGRVSSSTGLGTDVTIHVRCLGDADIALIEEQGMPDDETEALVCDGRQHDLQRSFATSPSSLEVVPVIDGPGTQAEWVVAVTTE
ncbi:hypothetical protein [Salsipaludibacter albus]|uniref:hypothetical protein n=1 Tax=Salsipaludibacter albus TaxID=2849650 RepID=UPI001EE4DAFD|nr:hypothetical protein [Salsipaludibacter albus]MBY5163696.1 hypothetical protein [Salsipaludibacter albus]